MVPYVDSSQSSSLDGDVQAVLLESTDIDDRVRATQQLQRERNFNSSILQDRQLTHHLS